MISTKEMKYLENNCSIDKVTLMENAGKGVFDFLKQNDRKKEKNYLVISYHGNNGGDGFVAARYLVNNGYNATSLFVGSVGKFKNEAKINFQKLIELEKKEKVKIIETDYKKIDLEKYDVILDCMLGTGIRDNSELKSPLKEIVELCNKSEAYKIAIDVPTGFNPDTGKKAKTYFHFDKILTFHDIKNGLNEFKDKTEIVDIGINQSSL